MQAPGRPETTGDDAASPWAQQSAADHDASAKAHDDNARRLDRHGASRLAEREREDARRERDAADEIKGRGQQ